VGRLACPGERVVRDPERISLADANQMIDRLYAELERQTGLPRKDIEESVWRGRPLATQQDRIVSIKSQINDALCGLQGVLNS